MRSVRRSIAWGAVAIATFFTALLVTPEEASAQETVAPPEAAQPAQAAPPPNVAEANERVGRGEQLFEQGDFDAALAEFEQAYEIIGNHPARFMILYNIGQSHERRFRYDLAMEYYRRYLTEGGPNAPDRTQVQASINALEGLLATLHINSNVPAQVWVEGRMMGESPGDVLVPAGRHVVEVRADGYAASQQEIQIAARTEQSLEFSLSESFAGLDPAVFWIFAASAVAVGLAGGAVGIAALVRRSDIDAQIAGPTMGFELGDGRAERDELETLALTADILYGGALLLGVTAVVLALLTNWDGSPEDESASAGLQFMPWASPTGAGAAVGASW
ncbi:MAG: tetratricopeptide repeat protein [Sandaracinaceae bacterium]